MSLILKEELVKVYQEGKDANMGIREKKETALDSGFIWPKDWFTATP